MSIESFDNYINSKIGKNLWNNSKYIGEKKGNLMHGKGIEINTDNTIYEGEF